MAEKLKREAQKLQEKERKQAEKEEKKEQKRQEEQRRERLRDQKVRESMGLSNIVSYQDIDFKKSNARAQADFIDAATAAMF